MLIRSTLELGVLMPREDSVEHHHISGREPTQKGCIDLYLDRERGEVRIVDTLNNQTAITISRDDWNELVDRIRSHRIGHV